MSDYPCIKPMFDFLCHELGREDESGWIQSIYKRTECGAWLVLVDERTIALGSIVEGSNEECETFTLSWPFTADDFWHSLAQIESEAAYIWERDNIMSNKHFRQQMSSDELLQCLQRDINKLRSRNRIDVFTAEDHMNVAEELHERAVRYEEIMNRLKSRA